MKGFPTHSQFSSLQRPLFPGHWLEIRDFSQSFAVHRSWTALIWSNLRSNLGDKEERERERETIPVKLTLITSYYSSF